MHYYFMNIISPERNNIFILLTAQYKISPIFKEVTMKNITQQPVNNNIQTTPQPNQSENNMNAMTTPTNSTSWYNQQSPSQSPQVQPQAVIGLFASMSDAEQAVNQLRSSGFSTEEINIVSKKDRYVASDGGNDSIMDGAMTGSALGTIGGLMLSAGALAIPGVGPIVAAGPLASAISGAVSGGIAGGLIDWGIPEDISNTYSSEVSSGSTLAVIKTEAAKVNQAAQILTSSGASNVETHPVK